jgi:hypothetical protein
LNFSIPHDPHFLLHELTDEVIYRLPPTGGRLPVKKVEMIIQQMNETFRYLEEGFNGCKLFTGQPSIEVLTFPSDDPNYENVLCEPGTEHLNPLPVSSKQVADWILDGSVVSGKVLLVACRRDLDRYLVAQYCNKYSPFSEQGREEIHNTKAEIVVFYCNNANSNSPLGILSYHQWLREKYPHSKQRYVILAHGINALYFHFEVKYKNNETIIFL